jgi:hypothetical protein
MTMIDPATGWFEIVEIDSRTADVIANVFEMTWLNRYPRPQKVIMDRGSEFKAEFQQMLKNDYGITARVITARNPQANSMVERAHQTLGNMIRSQRLRDSRDLPDGKWDGIVSALGFAMRSTVHTANRATPAQLVFGRDAMLNVSFEADWQHIKLRKQKLIKQNNDRENKKRKAYAYQVGQSVLVSEDPNRKYGTDIFRGPWTVAQVNENGTVRLTRGTANGGVVSQTWNVRNLKPYKD